jgi:hypothetical protein
VTFSQVELRMPSAQGDARVQAIWDDHLQVLVGQRKIRAFGAAGKSKVNLGVDVNGVRHLHVLENTVLLRRRDVFIDKVFPLDEYGFSGDRLARYPDVPVRAAYLDLVLGNEGERVLRSLAKSTYTIPERPFAEGTWQPDVEGAGEAQSLRWWVRMAGRTDTMSVHVARVEPESVRAHWAVWPSFRVGETEQGALGEGAEGQPKTWNTYYLFQRTGHRQLGVDPIWLRRGGIYVTRHLPSLQWNGQQALAEPVMWKEGTAVQAGRHDGGPPCALVLRNMTVEDGGAEHGCYWIRLVPAPKSAPGFLLSVDFGTSHSASAFGALTEPDTKNDRHITFGGERLQGAVPTTATVVCDREYVEAGTGGMIVDARWLPTSAPGSASMLPTELVVNSRIDPGMAASVHRWVPGRDFRIPSLEVSSEVLASQVVTDFKWDASQAEFVGQEPALRRQYLRSFLEMSLARIVRQRKMAPRDDQSVQMTFTWPLRSTVAQAREYQALVRDVLAELSDTTGIALGLRDDIGLHDESRAARHNTRERGTIYIVADLGGGTLDLLVSGGTANGDGDVADSIRVGGNLLLRHLAADPKKYLPQDGGWDLEPNGAAYAQLRAWMRMRGSPELFSDDQRHGVAELQNLKLRGFRDRTKGGPARDVLNRYFAMIVDYMARSLVAYVHDLGVTPAIPGRMAVVTLIRGNGWRLDQGYTNHADLADRVQAKVRERASALLESLPTDSQAKRLTQADTWISPRDYLKDDPKTFPVRNVLRETPMDPAPLITSSRGYAMIEVAHHGTPAAFPWHSPMPLPAPNPSMVEVHKVSPAVFLGTVNGVGVEMAGLSPADRSSINRELQNASADSGAGKLRVPLSALIYEACFTSEHVAPNARIDPHRGS